MVVDKIRLVGLQQYITQKLTDIYKNKRGEQQWMVTHQEAGFSQSAGMQIVNSRQSRLSTYAEVLRRRFVGGTESIGRTEGTGTTSGRSTLQERVSIDRINHGRNGPRKVSAEATTIPRQDTVTQNDEEPSIIGVKDEIMTNMDERIIEDVTWGKMPNKSDNKESRDNSLSSICQTYEEKLAQSMNGLFKKNSMSWKLGKVKY